MGIVASRETDDPDAAEVRAVADRLEQVMGTAALLPRCGELVAAQLQPVVDELRSWAIAIDRATARAARRRAGAGHGENVP